MDEDGFVYLVGRAKDFLKCRGERVGCVAIKTFRPWPSAEIREALLGARRVIVLEKALAIGIGGIVSQNIHTALEGSGTEIHTAIAGLGGRPITKAAIHRLIDAPPSGELTFVDLKTELVERELERALRERRSGPYSENVLRDLGIVAAGPV